MRTKIKDRRRQLEKGNRRKKEERKWRWKPKTKFSKTDKKWKSIRNNAKTNSRRIEGSKRYLS